mgnify:CR=1 FL=1
MAAMRAGLRTVILPKENEKDLADIDPTVRKALTFVTVDHADAVLEAALLRLPRKEAVPEQEETPETLPLPLPKTARKRKPEMRQ